MVTYPNIFIGLVLSGVIDYMDCGIVLNFNQNIAICLVFILFNQYMFFLIKIAYICESVNPFKKNVYEKVLFVGTSTSNSCDVVPEGFM